MKPIFIVTIAIILTTFMVFGWIGDAKKLFVVVNNSGKNMSWIDNEGQGTFRSVNVTDTLYLVEARYEGILNMKYRGNTKLYSDASGFILSPGGFIGEQYSTTGAQGQTDSFNFEEATDTLTFENGLLVGIS